MVGRWVCYQCVLSNYCKVLLFYNSLLAYTAFAQTNALQETPVCLSCHPGETASYLASPMGRSVGNPSLLKGGRTTHQLSGSTLTVEDRDGRMFHRIDERNLTAEYPATYRIGAGLVGFSYITNSNGYLFESPVSYFKQRGWDISPGYQDAQQLDFDRLLDENCLFCHTGSVKPLEGKPHRFAEPAFNAISCTRCHGPSADHVRHPSAKNIVNPAKLSVRARDSVCEQCHLEGEARILNPGKSLWNFRPGQDLEGILVVYIERGGREERAVSQSEELAQSQCARASGGKLWCGSCHNIHAKETERIADVRRICENCHTNLNDATHVTGNRDCVGCHMPRHSVTDVAHAAITDHRIMRRPHPEPLQRNAVQPELAAWKEPKTELQKRDLGLAYLQVARKRGLSHMGELGAKVLASEGVVGRNDVTALIDLGMETLEEGNTGPAAELFRRAMENQPANANAAMFLGIAQERAGKSVDAERLFNRTIDQDPSIEEAYFELAVLYAQQGRIPTALATLDRYLLINPQSIGARRAKALLTAERN